MTSPGPRPRLPRIVSSLLPVATGVAMIIIWYAIDYSMSSEQRFLLPAPHEVAKAFVTEGPALLGAALNTGTGALLGFGSAVALSFSLALVLSLSPLVRASFYPYLMILQMTPIIVMARFCASQSTS